MFEESTEPLTALHCTGRVVSGSDEPDLKFDSTRPAKHSPADQRFVPPVAEVQIT